MAPLGFCPRRFDRVDKSLNGDGGKIAKSWFGPISALWTECGRSMGTIHLMSLRMGADRFGTLVSGTQFNAGAGTLRRSAGLVSAGTSAAQDRRRNK